MNDNGINVSDPKHIAERFNKYIVNAGTDRKNHFKDYMAKIMVNKTFFLTPAIPEKLSDIILAFDIKKSLTPNSILVYILKMANLFFSDKLSFFRIFAN